MFVPTNDLFAAESNPLAALLPAPLAASEFEPFDDLAVAESANPEPQRHHHHGGGGRHHHHGG